MHSLRLSVLAAKKYATKARRRKEIKRNIIQSIEEFFYLVVIIFFVLRLKHEKGSDTWSRIGCEAHG
jgi:hypothetical protein